MLTYCWGRMFSQIFPIRLKPYQHKLNKFRGIDPSTSRAGSHVMSIRPCDQKNGWWGTWHNSLWLRRETMTRVKGLAKIKKKIERDVTDSRITTVELCDMTWHDNNDNDSHSRHDEYEVSSFSLEMNVELYSVTVQQCHTTVTLDCTGLFKTPIAM